MKQFNSFRVILILFYSSFIVQSNATEKDWWERANFYQIYPRSFKDSDGDGIGDLRGIIQKLDYLKEIGITAVWLSPIMKSPMIDFGYDISNYYEIQPEYGTTDDLDELIKKLHELGIKIILDFVPNHTSDEHEFFIKSAQRDPKYSDYYIWHPGKINNMTGIREPPNNWLSGWKYSAWEWNEVRQEYYYHLFSKHQADLNYRNPDVVEEMKNVLRYWMHKGIDGFRCDAVPTLFEVEADLEGNLPDEPLSGLCDDSDDFCFLDHIYTMELDATFDMVYQWRTVLDEYKQINGGDSKVMLTEASSNLTNTMRWFGTTTQNGSHIPFNFLLISNTGMESNASDFKNIIDIYLSALPVSKTSNWVMGNHDQRRLASRYGPERVDLLNILMQTLPGIAITYNGEEIGMEDVFLTWEETIDQLACNTNRTVYDSISRDPARTPFQWDDSISAGFSNNTKTWLPISSNYKDLNVKLQNETQRSHLKVYQKLVQLRKSNIMYDGSFESNIFFKHVYMYKRQLGDQMVVVVLNFSRVSFFINLNMYLKNLPPTLRVYVSSIESRYDAENIVNPVKFYSEANVGIVLIGSA